MSRSKRKSGQLSSSKEPHCSVGESSQPVKRARQVSKFVKGEEVIYEKNGEQQMATVLTVYTHDPSGAFYDIRLTSTNREKQTIEDYLRKIHEAESSSADELHATAAPPHTEEESTPARVQEVVEYTIDAVQIVAVLAPRQLSRIPAVFLDDGANDAESVSIMREFHNKYLVGPTAAKHLQRWMRRTFEEQARRRINQIPDLMAEFEGNEYRLFEKMFVSYCSDHKRTRRTRRWLKSVLRAHAPRKLEELSDMLMRHCGHEQYLIDKMARRFHLDGRDVLVLPPPHSRQGEAKHRDDKHKKKKRKKSKRRW